MFCEASDERGVQLLHCTDGLLGGEVLDDAAVGGFGIAGAKVVVGDEVVDGAGKGFDVVQGSNDARFFVDGDPAYTGAWDGVADRCATAVHALNEGNAEGFGFGVGGESVDVGCMQVATQVVIEQAAQELDSVGAGNGLQLSVDGTFAAYEDDAVALDVGIGADEVGESLVGDVASAGEDNLLSPIPLAYLVYFLLVAFAEVEVSRDESVLSYAHLVGKPPEGLGVGDVLWRSGDDEVCPVQDGRLERLDQQVHQSLGEDVGVPVEHYLRLSADALADKRIDVWVGAVDVYGLWLVLPQHLPQDAPVGEGDILAHKREVDGDAIDADAVDVLFAVDAVGGKADDDVAVGRHAFGQVLRHSLNAAQVGVVVFGYVQNSFH